MVGRVLQFLSNDLWRLRLQGERGVLPLGLQLLRVLALAWQHFCSDGAALMASSLTYYSLLSIVPVLAAAFGIAKGFGFEEALNQRLMSSFAEQQEVLGPAIEFAQSLLEETKGSVIAGVGVCFLLWSVIQLIGRIESSFNSIWKLRRSRSLARRFADYLALILICPLFFTVATSANLYIHAQLQELEGAWMSHISPAATLLVRLLPYFLLWGLFTFLYLFVPNTRVSRRAALLAGMLTGVGYVLLQWVYIQFQATASHYGAVYGSFAALPLFLLWLQMSWLLVLAGAELCAASQHLADYEFQGDCATASHRFRGLCSLAIMQQVTLRFSRGEPLPSRSVLSEVLHLPQRLLREQIDILVDERLLVELRQGEEEESTYQPGRPLDQLSLTTVLSALSRHGSEEIPLVDAPITKQLKERLSSLEEAMQASPADCLLTRLGAHRETDTPD